MHSIANSQIFGVLCIGSTMFTYVAFKKDTIGVWLFLTFHTLRFSPFVLKWSPPSCLIIIENITVYPLDILPGTCLGQVQVPQWTSLGFQFGETDMSTLEQIKLPAAKALHISAHRFTLKGNKISEWRVKFMVCGGRVMEAQTSNLVLKLSICLYVWTDILVFDMILLHQQVMLRDI